MSSSTSPFQAPRSIAPATGDRSPMSSCVDVRAPSPPRFIGQSTFDLIGDHLSGIELKPQGVEDKRVRDFQELDCQRQ